MCCGGEVGVLLLVGSEPGIALGEDVVACVNMTDGLWLGSSLEGGLLLLLLLLPLLPVLLVETRDGNDATATGDTEGVSLFRRPDSVETG
jgi:hypothetical protein